LKKLPKFTVVVCVKNEENRIEKCLQQICKDPPDELLVVDGNSSDCTREIAERYATRVICSHSGSLSRDRQRGIDESKNDLICMIDADHRVNPGDIKSLYQDLIEYKLDIVQSQLKLFKKSGFWDSAEEQMWDLKHNIPGVKKMIGVAPAIFKKKVFSYVKFDDYITSTIDDTDFMYRLSKFPEIRIGIGRTVIFQDHYSNFYSYVNKFKWYGKGDGEFCRKHPVRSLSMIYHLLVRYPIVYSVTAICNKKFKAVPFCIMQGYVRFFGLLNYLIKS